MDRLTCAPCTATLCSLDRCPPLTRIQPCHAPPQVTLPRQVLIIGDGSAEKRSYDEHGNQARIYAGRPGHAAVAQVGLKGVSLKESLKESPTG